MPFMLDCGAWSAWTRQVPIDLQEYIGFCKRHPQADYYVSLDVIPGSQLEHEEHTEELIDGAAARSWENYNEMVRHLPIEKVIPVYHHLESLKWLDKILDSKAPYIGIGFGRAKSPRLRMDWFQKIRPYLVDSEGKSLRAVHGFAVSDLDMMKYFPWHSVDSASWVLGGSFGKICTPHVVGGKFDYSLDPIRLYTSDVSSMRGAFNSHTRDMSPIARNNLDDYLASCGVTYGHSEEVDVPPDYKLQRGLERWGERGKRIIRIVERGVTNYDQCRKLVNAVFFLRVNEAVPIKRVYLAGGGVKFRIEKMIKNRLFAYPDLLSQRGAAYELFLWHCENTEKESMA